LYKSELSSFSLVTFGFVIFWRQNIGEKVAHKMLMKSTPGYQGKSVFNKVGKNYKMMMKVQITGKIRKNSEGK